MVLVGLIVIFFIAGISALILAYEIFQPQITVLLRKATAAQVSPPTSQTGLSTHVAAPGQTPACDKSTLQLATASWRIEPIQLSADGSVNVPAGNHDAAYWINDLESNSVFALSPSPENFAKLKALQGGEEARVIWDNCKSATFTLFSLQVGAPSKKVFADQTSLGIVVYVPETSSTSGLLVLGVRAEETIKASGTAKARSNEINAEISLLAASTSADKTTIQVEISIFNYGAAPITFSESDISLIPEGASPLALSRSDPELPQDILPVEGKLFSLIFPRPAVATATLKIFTIEYGLED
jgi:hypothetical protein